jgi:hypothetical protein
MSGSYKPRVHVDSKAFEGYAVCGRKLEGDTLPYPKTRAELDKSKESAGRPLLCVLCVGKLEKRFAKQEGK